MNPVLIVTNGKKKSMEVPLLPEREEESKWVVPRRASLEEQ